jgi:hypothetical protein
MARTKAMSSDGEEVVDDSWLDRNRWACDRDRRDHEEVRPLSARGGGQERPPGLRWRWSAANHVFRDHGLTHGNPELLQLAVVRGAPRAGSRRT